VPGTPRASDPVWLSKMLRAPATPDGPMPGNLKRGMVPEIQESRMPDDSMTFPSDWPEGCPSEDAQPASGEVFACCTTNPPRPKDFRTAHERDYRPDADRASGAGCRFR
jgi:hypothetical protein